MNEQYQGKQRTCDIVMKGGITSGVVYPRAIVALSKRFRFVNLGGTSAGAIAAAAAAAAEYRRSINGSNEGFEMLGTLGDDLATVPESSSQTRLFSLFRPNADPKNANTHRLFAVLTGALGKEGKAAVVALLRSGLEIFAFAALLGAVPGILLTAFSIFHFDAGWISWLWTGIGFLFLLAGAAIAVVVAFVREFIREVPRNNFGLCTGMSDPGAAPSSEEPLTVWLTDYLNKVAGFTVGHRPLIFDDLWGPNTNTDPTVPRSRRVNLEMMTTNLTHCRPYRLPFRADEDLDENHLFYFREDEFRRLFPASVVDWMIGNPRPIREINPEERTERENERYERKEAGFFPMPAPENLPVVVVTRMSLSFPVLLCAIPLHSIDRSKPEKFRTLERCWFTDGGLCSNFPLHFFDSALPRRPTFSIDLTEKPYDTKDEDLKPNMDERNVSTPMDRWNRFDLTVFADPAKQPMQKPGLGKLTGFISALITTMQNWNDATQSRLPGYHDRIVRIPLTSRQGGLNLNMPTEVVKFLTGQGEACAAELMHHFDPDDPKPEKKMTWENHRWVRIRALLAALEKMAEQIGQTCSGPENGDVSYEAWLQELLDDKTGKYKKLSYAAPTKEQLRAALETLRQIQALNQIWKDAGTAAENSPRPRPVLRPRPQT